MAAGDDDEHTRFPCLATVRYAVVTVVTVLAVIVVVMVIHVVLRSEEIRLYVHHGHIEADRLWFVAETVASGTSVGRDDRSPLTLQPDVGTAEGVLSAFGPRSIYREPVLGSSDSKKDSTTTTNNTRSGGSAERVNLRVILRANNPGGRSKIDCDTITVRITDNTFTEIAMVGLANFTVPQQTAHTLHKQVSIINQTKLSYLSRNYRGQFSFPVIVAVYVNVTSYYPLNVKKTTPLAYLCWPVTVSLTDYYTLQNTDDVACKTMKEVQFSFLPPA